MDKWEKEGGSEKMVEWGKEWKIDTMCWKYKTCNLFGGIIYSLVDFVIVFEIFLKIEVKGMM